MMQLEGFGSGWEKSGGGIGAVLTLLGFQLDCIRPSMNSKVA